MKKTNYLSGYSIILFVVLTFSSSVALAGPISKAQQKHRLHHAKQLLGKHYNRSIVSTGEQVDKINKMIYAMTKKSLPKKYKKRYKKIAQTIIDQSYKYKFDPIFLMAVIQSESSFRPDIIGGVGEIGLMQIRPTTAEWIAKKKGLRWKNKNQLKDPVENIKIGAAYFSYLRERFDDHARLYIAAYNMGGTNVKRALRKKIWPKTYPIHVMKNYVDFYKKVDNRITSSKIAAN